MEREKSYTELYQSAMEEDQKLGPVYGTGEQDAAHFEGAGVRRFRVAGQAVRVTLPSSLLHHSHHSTTLGRQKASESRRRGKARAGAAANMADNAAKGGGRRCSTVHPETLARAQDKGLKLDYDDSDVVDEVDRLEQLEVIRQMPVPIKIKRKLRNKLFDKIPEINKDAWDMCVYNCRVRNYRCRLKSTICWREFRMNTTLWSGAFKTIEGHFGAGVLTYFKFLKWLFQLNLLIFLLVFLFVLLPEAALDAGDYSSSVTGSENATNAEYLAVNCSEQYQVNVTNTPIQRVLDFLQGTGWMEKTSMFYGFYSDREMAAFAGWHYNMPLAYILICSAYFIISLVLMIHHTAKGFHERLFANEESLKQYCNKVFSGWDFAMDDPKNNKLKQKSICRDIAGTLEEEREKARRKHRSGKERCGILVIRMLVNLVVLALLGGSGYLIYWVTIKTTEVQEGAAYQTYSYIVQFLISYTTSLTITILNALVPVVFKRLVRFEDYMPGLELNMTLGRTVFLRLASIGVLIFTLYSEITCTPQDMCGVGESPACTPIQCWETYVGQEFHKLVIMDFLVCFCVTFFVEFPRKLIVSKCSCKLTRIVGFQQFDITKNVLDLVYGQVLLWLGTFFSPIIPAVCVMKLFLVFYIKELTLLVNYTPSPTNYRASDSQSFFLLVLLAAFTVCVIPILFIIFRMTPSRGCGPFRIYDRMYDILPITVNSWPQWIQNICEWIFSAMILIPLFIILCLVIYYLDKISKSYKKMTNVLKEQLHMEGRDKQFLMARIQELSGGDSGGTKKALTPPTIHEESEEVHPKVQQRASGTLDNRDHAYSPPNVPDGI